MRGVLRCPVQGCDYHVEDFYEAAYIYLGVHLRDNHNGFSSLTREEKERYKEQRMMVRVQTRAMLPQCFPARG